jgi:5-formyltetrahydrofolate cyclo-ligase
MEYLKKKIISKIEMENKNLIRNKMKIMKLQVPDSQKLVDANDVFKKIELMTEFEMAKTVLLYWSLPDELPTHDFVEKWCNSKQIFLPVLDRDEIIVKQFSSQKQMTAGKWGILEPNEKKCFSEKIDLVVVPGVAFDIEKNRLGRGKGYYDRFLSRINTFCIGICYDFQLIKSVPVNSHDVKMNAIITPSKFIR